MDRVRQGQPLRFTKYKVFSFLSLPLLIWLLYFYNSGTTSIKGVNLITTVVQKGNIDVVVEGYGQLKSEKVQLVTSKSKSIVREVFFKAGQSVDKDTVLARLENHELSQELLNAQRELSRAEANIRQLKIKHKRQKLDEDSALQETYSSFELARLKRTSLEKLVEQGIVSRLSFEESRLEEQQLEKKIAAQSGKFEQLLAIQKEEILIHLEQLRQANEDLVLLNGMYEGLEVKAGFGGILQRFSVEVGQTLIAGQEIALVGSVDDLVAIIKVPQVRISQVQIGQKVFIDTRGDEVEGTVSRIAPIVTDNSVEVEINLIGRKPTNARPQLDVSGTIIIEQLENVLYIERPGNLQANSTESFYRLNGGGSTAVLTHIMFGQRAGKFIQVLGGAKEHDVLILSDLNSFKVDNNELKIL